MSILHGGDVPKLVRRMPLEQYAEELAGDNLFVWLNPPRDMRMKYDEILGRMIQTVEQKKKLPPDHVSEAADLDKAVEAQAVEIDTWLATIWSQGPDGTAPTPEEVSKLRKDTFERDPQLFSWLARKTLEMMGTYRNELKKV